MLKDDSEQVVTPKGLKSRAIIAYLCAHPDNHVSRARLVDLLWGDREESHGRASLRQCLLEIRKSAPDLVSADRTHLWISASRLEECEPSNGASAGEAFEELDDITPEFDSWLRSERAGAASLEWDRLERDAERLIGAGNGADAIVLIECMERIDPYNEDWLRLAMRAEYEEGHPAGIQLRFKQMADRLKADLGVSISSQSKQLHDALLAGLGSGDGARPIAMLEPVAVLPRPAALAAARKPSRSRWFTLAGAASVVALLAMSQSSLRAQPDTHRIAVLPFQALDGVDPLVAEGISEELLTKLSQEQKLQVVGRTSSWMFKGKAADLRKVGRQLHVDYLVEGSAQKRNGVMRVTVTLVDASNAAAIWSRKFVSQTSDIQLVEETAGSAIVRQLGLPAGPQTRLAHPVAYANYIRAKAAIRDRQLPKYLEARELLQDAIRIDPKFAPAWAQLSGTLTFLGKWNYPREGGNASGWHREAMAAARRAIALDPNLADGHAMLALALGFYSREAQLHLQRALELEPSNSQALYWWGTALSYTGRVDQGVAFARRSEMVDPLWLRPVTVVALNALTEGRRDEAYQYVARLKRADPGAAVAVEMALARQEGDLSRVIAIGRDPRNSQWLEGSDSSIDVAMALVDLGYVREALLLTNAPPYPRALVQRNLPDRATILANVGNATDESEIGWKLRGTVYELSRAGRYGDIAALYDYPGSILSDLPNIKSGNRAYRLAMAAPVGRALLKQGRKQEAVRLFRAAEEAGRVFLPNKALNGEDLATIAMNEAIFGRKGRAIGLLGKAVGRGWTGYEGSNTRIEEMPWFAGLRGDPRFEQLLRRIDGRLARERRETEALGLI